MDPQVFTIDLLIVLAAGLLAGAACKRLGISLLVGYLVVGGLIGNGVLGLVTQENHELEYLARTGALLLLFSDRHRIFDRRTFPFEPLLPDRRNRADGAGGRAAYSNLHGVWNDMERGDSGGYGGRIKFYHSGF